ncbi:MAG: RHS repeat-associated core domain-containing protein [Pyrinomonadaceae bacterium]
MNLFSGNLNFNLPFLSVGGRGEVSQVLSLTLESQWTFNHYQDAFENHGYEFYPINPSPHAFSSHLTSEGYSNADFQDPCMEVPMGNPQGYWVHHQFNFAYVEPDGTEHKLVDRYYHGRPFQTCGSNNIYYGRVFESVDGTFLTFITDADVYTLNHFLTGYLYFKNGTKSRVEDGRIVWTQDRNGNKIEYWYDPNYPWPGYYPHVSKIRDSIGREINFEYGVTDIAPYGLCDRITYKGFGGDDRTIRISRDSLHNVLRFTQPEDSSTVKTYGELFPDYPNDNVFLANPPNEPSDPECISALWLPDGRSYQFKYNVYGRLARVVMPTGGSVEYDYEPSELVGAAGPLAFVVNRVKEKRLYDANGLVNRQVFTFMVTSEGFPSGIGGTVVDVEQFDAGENRLTKTKHFFYGIPGGSPPFNMPWRNGREFKTETFDSNGTTLLRSVEMDWRQRLPAWCFNNPYVPNICGLTPSETGPAINTFVVETKTTLVDNNLVSKVSAVNPASGEWAFDAYNNQTGSWIYDYGVGQPGALIKHVQTSFINHENVGGVYLFGLPTSTNVYGVNSSGQESLAASTQILYDEAQYPLLTYGTTIGWQNPGALRGNPTTVKRWLNTNGSWIETHVQYDQLGNARKSWDALANISEISYEDAFTDGINRNAHAFPTQSTSSIPDSAGVNGSDTAFVSSSVYDYFSGLVTTATDINGHTSTMEYVDGLDRLTKVVNPAGGGWTSFEYVDTVGNLYVRTQTALDASRTTQSYTFFDSLGRATRAFNSEDEGWIGAEVQYDALGRVSRGTNPYRTATLNSAASAPEWTTLTYDALGRGVTVKTADNAELLTSYEGNEVMVTDQAGKKRKLATDALGRLTNVHEDPAGPNHPNGLNYMTSYEYDALDNLTTVSQGGQTRSLEYDSLKRLISAANPENGAISYDYDANGNLVVRTDARSVSTHYEYDALNRQVRRWYNGSNSLTASTSNSPALPSGVGASDEVNYFYDGKGVAGQVANALGRLTKVSSPVSSTLHTEFDAMGRVKSNSQVTNGETYTLNYAYDLAGNLTSQTYPSGRVVATEYDGAGRIAGVKSTTSGSYYAGGAANDTPNRIQYAAHGSMSLMRLGNGLWEHAIFNSRLQPTEIGLGTTQGSIDRLKLSYEYGTNANNGNVLSQTIAVPTIGGVTGFTATQSYDYDFLNRLLSAEEMKASTQQWKQSYLYDRYGNRRIDTGTDQNGKRTTDNISPGPTENPTISTVNNRFDANQGYGYDNAGNLTAGSNKSFEYDGENHQVSFDANPLTEEKDATYSYDGDGRRVKKVSGGTTTIFVHNIAGQLVAEYSDAQQSSVGGTSYLTSDTLGSLRVVTNESGAVKARHDYLPFGEEMSLGRNSSYVGDDVRKKFTGYERDTEASLDFAQARYYSSVAGRFTTTDPFLASARFASPQTWNRYSYALNNPLAYIDPTGMDPKYHWITDGNGNYTALNDKQYDDWLYSDSTWHDVAPGTNIGRLTYVKGDDSFVDTNEGLIGSEVTLGADGKFHAVLATDPSETENPSEPPEEISEHVARDNDDFRQVNLSIAPKILAGVGVHFAYAWDKYHRGYVSVGPTAGIGFPVSVSAVTGQTILGGKHVRDKANVEKILTGPSAGFNICPVVCFQGSWNISKAAFFFPSPGLPNGTGSTMAMGAGVPDISVGKDWTWRVK